MRRRALTGGLANLLWTEPDRQAKEESLGLLDRATSLIDVDEWLPAVGQGVIAIVARSDDAATLRYLAAVTHRDTAIALTAERAYLDVLDGSCRTPIGRYAVSGSRR